MRPTIIHLSSAATLHWDSAEECGAEAEVFIEIQSATADPPQTSKIVLVGGDLVSARLPLLGRQFEDLLNSFRAGHHVEIDRAPQGKEWLQYNDEPPPTVNFGSDGRLTWHDDRKIMDSHRACHDIGEHSGWRSADGTGSGSDGVEISDHIAARVDCDYSEYRYATVALAQAEARAGN